MASVGQSSPQISRVSMHALTPQQFNQQFQVLGWPVVITDLLESEPDWNLNYLCDQIGEQSFLIRCYGRDRHSPDKRQWTTIGSGVPVQMLRFRDYAELLRNRQAHSQDLYLAKCPLHETPLGQSLALQNLGECLGLRQPLSNLNLWVGPGGHVESLHYDPSDGTLMQLHGDKKVMLFPPHQWANLYAFPISVHLRHGMKLRCWFSQVNLNAPDFEAFPQLPIALQHQVEVILKAGELLYIPAGWWHEVTALGTEMSCSVNRFWSIEPRSRQLLSWPQWRTYLGSACAIPQIMASLIQALLSSDPKQKMTEIRRLI
ncbi:cupin-like domain-containing protein [Synechococcales cyanobacterium C]|uniref:Cupin-like domain-containing protein n=1 Tax=Petrachloros mirabilis ULC683 TaxID=2781853 RepID=A0A8K2A5Y5_9CYAN|nr:cupin-like domain-containing protein [Petrachloros mirabilis]NCJ04944.1 cupin-like domain-containing protein [Petrachloros mirabilis ULC683]